MTKLFLRAAAHPKRAPSLMERNNRLTHSGNCCCGKILLGYSATFRCKTWCHILARWPQFPIKVTKNFWPILLSFRDMMRDRQTNNQEKNSTHIVNAHCRYKPCEKKLTWKMNILGLPERVRQFLIGATKLSTGMVLSMPKSRPLSPWVNTATAKQSQSLWSSFPANIHRHTHRQHVEACLTTIFHFS